MTHAAGLMLIMLIVIFPWLFIRQRKWILRVTYLGVALFLSVPLMMLSGVALMLSGIIDCTAGGDACGAGAVVAFVLLFIATIASGFILLSGLLANSVSKKLEK